MTEQESNKQRLRDLLALVDVGHIEAALAFYAPDYLDHDASESRHGEGDPIAVLRAAFAGSASAGALNGAVPWPPWRRPENQRLAIERHPVTKPQHAAPRLRCRQFDGSAIIEAWIPRLPSQPSPRWHKPRA